MAELVCMYGPETSEGSKSSSRDPRYWAQIFCGPEASFAGAEAQILRAVASNRMPSYQLLFHLIPRPFYSTVLGTTDATAYAFIPPLPASPTRRWIRTSSVLTFCTSSRRKFGNRSHLSNSRWKSTVSLSLCENIRSFIDIYGSGFLFTHFFYTRLSLNGACTRFSVDD